MSRALLMRLIIPLLVGVIITSLSYFYTSRGLQFICAPVNPGPLDELSAYSRVERGFPFVYYQDEVPENCGLPTADVMNSINGSIFIPNFFLVNTAIWSALALIVSEIGRHMRRRNKK